MFGNNPILRDFVTFEDQKSAVYYLDMLTAIVSKL